MSDTSCFTLDNPDQIDTPTIFSIKSNKFYMDLFLEGFLEDDEMLQPL